MLSNSCILSTVLVVTVFVAVPVVSFCAATLNPDLFAKNLCNYAEKKRNEQIQNGWMIDRGTCMWSARNGNGGKIRDQIELILMRRSNTERNKSNGGRIRTNQTKTLPIIRMEQSRRSKKVCFYGEKKNLLFMSDII